MKVGVIGAGYWGPNLIRNLHELGVLAGVCDLSTERLAEVAGKFGCATTTAFEDFLADPAIGAVAIATPAPTHARLAAQALAAGKHVFVEKPMALSAREAEGMARQALEAGKVMMVGHVLEYHPAFLALLGLVREGTLGALRHVRSTRLNLGKLRLDENVLWSFAPHDISLLLRLIGEEPTAVSATGSRILGLPREDVVHGDLTFPGGSTAHVHVSWLEPVKAHQLVVIGTRRMAVFNDTLAEGKLRLYDKGFDEGADGAWTIRNGAETIIDYPPSEPMKAELEDFLQACAGGPSPVADAVSGVRVIRTLERLDQCLRPLETAK